MFIGIEIILYPTVLNLSPIQKSAGQYISFGSLDEGLAQNPTTRMEIARSSQDNLTACEGSTGEPLDMPVPPIFTPLGQKAGERAKTKVSSMVMRNEKTVMESI